MPVSNVLPAYDQGCSDKPVLRKDRGHTGPYFGKDNRQIEGVILDANVLKEMKAYTNTDLEDSNVGLITRHFDLLTAVVIGWQMRKVAIGKPKPRKKNTSFNRFAHI